MQIYSQNFITFKAISLDKNEIKRTEDLLRKIDSPIQKEQAELELFDIFDEQEKHAEQLENVQKLIKPLYLKEQDLLIQRAIGKTYMEIAKDKQTSFTLISRRIKSAIAKIQLKNNTLLEKYSQLADKFIETFDLKLRHKEAINFLINKIELMHCNIDTLNNNVETSSRLLELDKKAFIQAALRQPQLFYHKPETIFNNIATTSKFLKIDRKMYTSAALKAPSLFYITPERIFNNIYITSQSLEINRKDYITAALMQPQLFYQKPETITGNINTTATLLEIDKKDFVSAALMQPPLFYQKPTTIFNNIDTISKLLGIDRKDFVSRAIKQPQLFYLKPTTIAKKVNIIKYYKQIQGKDNTKIVLSSTDSDKKLYYNILAYLIKKHDGLKKALSKKELINYLKTQNKIYNLSIPQNELFEEFTKYAHDFSQSNLNKLMFNILKSK